MTTPIDIDALMAIAEKATPKWSARERGYSVTRDFEIVQAGGGILFRSTSYGQMENDANFIGEFDPFLVKQLLTEVSELRSLFADLAKRTVPGTTDSGDALLAELRQLRAERLTSPVHEATVRLRIQKEVEEANAENARLKEQLDWYKSGDIHTHNDNCKRPMCILHKRIALLEAALKRFCYCVVGGYKARTPCAACEALAASRKLAE